MSNDNFQPIGDAELITIRPDTEVMTRQKLPYFIGISEQTTGSTGLSMHLVVIPPGANATPHFHQGFETGIYVLEGQVETRYGRNLEKSQINQAGDFLFIPSKCRKMQGRPPVETIGRVQGVRGSCATVTILHHCGDQIFQGT